VARPCGPRRTSGLVGLMAVNSSSKGPSTAKLAALFVVAVSALGVAAAHPTIAAAIGSAELSFLGVPQLIKNFREKASAARDISLESTLIWLFVAGLLSIVSWIRQSSVWYILMNGSGVVQSTLMLVQINAYAPSARAFRTSAVSASSIVIVGLLALRGKGAAPTAWAYVLFPIAMGLLIVMNLPQILKNYRLFRAQSKAPRITPIYPGMVITGSCFHLIAAVSFKDSFWAVNSALSVAQASVLLGQVLLPGKTNTVLGRFAGLRRYLVSKNE